jgi:hypothetical protein
MSSLLATCRRGYRVGLTWSARVQDQWTRLRERCFIKFTLRNRRRTWRQRVLDSRGDDGVHATPNDAVSLEQTQCLNQHFLRDAANQAFQFTVPPRAPAERTITSIVHRSPTRAITCRESPLGLNISGVLSDMVHSRWAGTRR